MHRPGRIGWVFVLDRLCIVAAYKTSTSNSLMHMPAGQRFGSLWWLERGQVAEFSQRSCSNPSRAKIHVSFALSVFQVTGLSVHPSESSLCAAESHQCSGTANGYEGFSAELIARDDVGGCGADGSLARV